MTDNTETENKRVEHFLFFKPDVRRDYLRFIVVESLSDLAREVQTVKSDVRTLYVDDNREVIRAASLFNWCAADPNEYGSVFVPRSGLKPSVIIQMLSCAASYYMKSRAMVGRGLFMEENFSLNLQTHAELMEALSGQVFDRLCEPIALRV